MLHAILVSTYFVGYRLFGHLLLLALDKLLFDAAIRLGEDVLIPPTGAGMSVIFT